MKSDTTDGGPRVRRLAETRARSSIWRGFTIKGSNSGPFPRLCSSRCWAKHRRAKNRARNRRPQLPTCPLCNRLGLAAQQRCLADEVLVLADPEIREHGAPDVARLVDQIRGPANAQAQRAVDLVHPDHEFLDVREQNE